MKKRGQTYRQLFFSTPGRRGSIEGVWARSITCRAARPRTSFLSDPRCKPYKLTPSGCPNKGTCLFPSEGVQFMWVAPCPISFLRRDEGRQLYSCALLLH